MEKEFVPVGCASQVSAQIGPEKNPNLKPSYFSLLYKRRIKCGIGFVF